MLRQMRRGIAGTYRTQNVLVHTLVALLSEVRPEKGTLAGAWTATKEDQFL